MLGDEAHTPEQVTPMRAQQAHVKVTSPAKAHRVSTSTMAKHGRRLRMESARLSIPYRRTREREVLKGETSHPPPDISTYVIYTIIPSSCALRKGGIDPRHTGHGGGEGRDRHGRVTCYCPQRAFRRSSCHRRMR